MLNREEKLNRFCPAAMPGDGAIALLRFTGRYVSCETVGPPMAADADCARAGDAAHSAQNPTAAQTPWRIVSPFPENEHEPIARTREIPSNGGRVKR